MTMIEKLTLEPEDIGKLMGSKGKSLDKVQLRALARVLVGLQELKSFSVAPVPTAAAVDTASAGQGSIVPYQKKFIEKGGPKARAISVFEVATPKGMNMKVELSKAAKFWARVWHTLAVAVFRFCIWFIPGCVVASILMLVWEFICHLFALPYACLEMVSVVGSNLPAIARSLASQDGVSHALQNYRGWYQHKLPVQPSTMAATDLVHNLSVSNGSSNVTIVYMQSPPVDTTSGMEWAICIFFGLAMWMINQGGD